MVFRDDRRHSTPYILLNLGALGRRYKVFMGDAGSTMIGFTIIWILLETTQGKTHPISPVTALWIIAIPLMDMVAIMYRRLRKGMSPFSPDRQHIHHLIMRAGFTSRRAFVLITTPPPCWRWLASWRNTPALCRNG